MSKRTEFAISLKLLADNFKNGLGKVQTQLNNFKKTLITAFASLGAIDIGKQLVRAGAEFEDAMARVNAVSKASTTELKSMRNEAMKLGRDTKYTATEAANALEQLVRNGLQPLAAQKALSGTLQLAQSQAISLQEAADIATTAMNGFGKSADDLGRINDVLAATASNTATNVLELFEALKVAAPVATAAGISMEETMAVLGQLANKGFRGSEAGTGLKQIILALASQTPEAQKVAEKYGFAVDETTIKTKGLIAVLKELSKSGIGNSMADLGDYFNKLGAPKGAAILGDTEMLDELYQTIANSQGEAARMFEEGLGAWEKAYKTLISVWENTQIKVFDSGKKIFTEPLNILAEFLRRIQDLPTVATAAFGLLSTKIGTIFSKTRKELDDIAEKQFADKLLKNQNAYQNASIAHAATNAASGIQLNPNIKDGYIQLQRELQGLTTKFDMNTKYGIVLKKALNDLNTIVNASRTDTKKYQKALADLTLQMQALGNKAKHTKLDVIATNMQNVQRTTTSVGGTIQGVIKKIGTGLSTLGTSVLNFFGGWVGVIMTLATTIGTYLVSAWRKSTEAVRNAQKTMSEAIDNNQKLDSSFVSLINVLRQNEQSSIAWQAAIAKLKREYPELLEKLHLEQISVNQSAQEYAKLRDRIKEVIEWQKQYNLYDAAMKAREEMLDTFFTNETALKHNEFKDAERRFTGNLERNGYTKDEAKFIGTVIKGEMQAGIANGLRGADLQSHLKGVIEKLVQGNDKVLAYADSWAREYTNSFEYSDVAKAFDNIGKKYLTKPEDVKTTEDVDKLISNATDAFAIEREKLTQKADAQGWDKSKLDSEIASVAKKLVDELTDNLQGMTYTNKKGDKKDALEYGKNQKGYQSLLQQSKLNTKVGLGDDEKKIQNAQEQYASALGFASRQLELGYINEMEYNKKKLTAIQALINSYETNGDVVALNSDVYKDLINQQNSLIKTLKEQEDAAEQAKENERQSKVFEKKSERLGKDYRNNITNREKPNKWDYFDFDSADEGKTKSQEIQLDDLKEQLNELKQLRGSISDEEIEKAKSLNNVASEELLKWVNKLDGEINGLSETVTNLEDKFKLEKAKEEIKQLKREIGEGLYEGVKESFGAISQLGDIISSFEGFDEMNAFEKFQTITDTIFTTIDTIKGLIDTWTTLNEILELFGLKKQALATIEASTATANAAAVQGEAAAVVAAETEKTAAITTAHATQTGVILAAKAAQTKAAQIAMAAESTAAYAYIPFAGPALAAAQIAEMEALIAAAAALPAFANGGIVGGTSYVGDKNLARVNSGEMIMNGTQQKHLWDAISNNRLGGNSLGGKVEFEISGQKLKGVLNNYDKKISKVK